MEHWNAHHGSFNVGAGHHQDLPQSARQTECETLRYSPVEGNSGKSKQTKVRHSDVGVLGTCIFF